jgi:hypothetical protein
LAGFAGYAEGFAGFGVIDQDHVAAVAAGDGESFVGVMDRDLFFEELLEGDAHACEEADESADQVFDGLFHGD